jgi:serine/threonine protein kinase
LKNLAESIDMLDIADWMIAPENIQIGDMISENFQSNSFHALWKGSRVVVKVPKLEEELSDRQITTLKQEIAAIRKTNHGNIIEICGASLSYPDICIVTPFQDYGNLGTLLYDPDIEISPQDAMKYAIHVAKGLYYLHDLKPSPICHGNIKLSNILVVILT